MTPVTLGRNMRKSGEEDGPGVFFLLKVLALYSGRYVVGSRDCRVVSFRESAEVLNVSLTKMRKIVCFMLRYGLIEAVDKENPPWEIASEVERYISIRGKGSAKIYHLTEKGKILLDMLKKIFGKDPYIYFRRDYEKA